MNTKIVLALAGIATMAVAVGLSISNRRDRVSRYIRTHSICFIIFIFIFVVKYQKDNNLRGNINDKA